MGITRRLLPGSTAAVIATWPHGQSGIPIRRPRTRAGASGRAGGTGPPAVRPEDTGQSGGRCPICVEVGNEGSEIPPEKWEENVEGHSDPIADRWGEREGTRTTRRCMVDQQEVLWSLLRGKISGSSEDRAEALKTGSRSFPYTPGTENRYRFVDATFVATNFWVY